MKKKSEVTASANLPLIIVNPVSAAGSTQLRWAKTASDLAAHFGAYQVEFTRKTGDGIELAKKAAEAGRKFIIACGGDGTINEVANGILQSGQDAELGVVPSGTGGDFRRTIGMPQSASEAARGLRDGTTKTIDVGRVTFLNFKNEETSRYFLNISSVGLSASIIERVKTKNKLEWIPGNLLRGKTTFALSTLQEVLDLDFITVKVKIDDGAAKPLSTINFAVCNSRFFGGGMKIAPVAKINDGFFDVINIGDIKTAKILLNAYKLYSGTHLELKEVKSALGKRVEISPMNNEEIHPEIDGELLGKLPAVYEIVPNALKVRVPKV